MLTFRCAIISNYAACQTLNLIGRNPALSKTNVRKMLRNLNVIYSLALKKIRFFKGSGQSLKRELSPTMHINMGVICRETSPLRTQFQTCDADLKPLQIEDFIVTQLVTKYTRLYVVLYTVCTVLYIFFSSQFPR